MAHLAYRRAVVTLQLMLLCVLLCFLSAAVVKPVSAMQPYSEADAWRYHYYLRATYCDANPVDTWTCGSACTSVPGFQVYAVLDSRDLATQGFVGLDHSNAQIVVSFRGSDNLENWIANIILVQTPYSSLSSCGVDCRVHTGFMVGYLTLRQKTRAAVLALLSAYPTYGIVVTGHSLGGALATLAAADLQELLNRGNYNPAPLPLTLYTYGSPRVGNVAFATWVNNLLSNGASYRITHARDPVPRLPFRNWGYAHLPHEVFYKNEENSSRIMCVDSVTKQDMKCSGGMFSVVFEDHEYYMGESTECDYSASDPSAHEAKLTWKMYLQLFWEYVKGIF